MTAKAANHKALVTGGAGFIGSALVRRLVRWGYSVVNIDKLTYAANKEALAAVEASHNHRFVEGDIADRNLMRQIMADESPDVVFHLAAESHVDRSIDRPTDFIKTNIVGTFELLESALVVWSKYCPEKRERFRFLHISTDEVFGMLGDEGVFCETSPYKPSSPYSASKAGSDHLARAWFHTYGLPVIVTNCSNNFGPFQHPEKFIPTVIRNAIAGSAIPIYGTGENVRDWIFVEDHVDGLIKASQTGQAGETYLFGGRAERSNLDLARSICCILDALVPKPSGKSYVDQITFVQDRPHHDFRYAVDPTKSECELEWCIGTAHDVGLERTIRWYLEFPGFFLRDSGELERQGVSRSRPGE